MESEITHQEQVASVFGNDTSDRYEIEVGVENDKVGRRYSVTLTVKISADGELGRCHLSAGTFSEHTDEGDLDGLVEMYKQEIERDFPGRTDEEGHLGKQLVEAAQHAVEMAESHDGIPYNG